jgi:hypothetical protein
MSEKPPESPPQEPQAVSPDRPTPAGAAPRPVKPGAGTGMPVKSRVVVPSSRGKEIAIAIVVAAVVLGLILWGTLTMKSEQGKPSRNQLSGTIVAKHDIGEREEQISVGRKGLDVRAGDTGYWFDVKVEPGGRIYEVPVSEAQYKGKKVGDSQVFIRPPSEQR